MCLHVVVEIGHLGKGAPAVLFYADERTFARVKAPMVVEVRYLSECLATIFANEGSLVEVDALVVSQIGGLREPLLAELAGVLLLCRVVFNVREEGGLAAEDLSAKWTGGCTGVVLYFLNGLVDFRL